MVFYQFPIILSLILILTTNLLATTNGAVLENVCHQTKDESLCLTYLRPESGSETANLPGLAQITIDKAQFDAIGFKTKIHALVVSSLKNPRLNKLYRDCESFYDNALDALTIAPEHLAKRRYGKLGASGAIVSSVGRCGNLFTDGNKELGILGNVITVIANNLVRGVEAHANAPQRL